MDFDRFDLEASKHPEWNIRWIQPPQAAYLVSTVDKAGNANLTPVTMGTAMYSPEDEWWYSVAVFNERDACSNLLEVPECVIGYYGPDLTYKSWIAALPIPRGISEFDVADLTLLPSQKVRPCGVHECPVNLEMVVHYVQRLGAEGGSTMFTGKIVAASVGSEYVRRDVQAEERVGVLAIDPVFEVLIASREVGPDRPSRLYYARMQRDRLYRDSDDIGCSNDWIGDFGKWMSDEEKRGRIAAGEREELLELYRRWRDHPDPADNGPVKRALTERLREMVWRKV
jgi:flavin reductase (DIM6/NTAB) family NADH-FMN oxidoreductase RutF